MEKILIADDDAALRSLLRLVAVRCGFAVDTATNGHEALELIKANRYVIAVVDLMMPVLSGYDVVERLRDMKDKPAVLVVTAMTDTYVPRLDGRVVHSIIRKPFDIDMVSAVLTELAAALRAARAKADDDENVIDFPSRAC